MFKKPPPKPRASVFARALQQLLDDTGFYTRAQWGQFLGISAPALSQWVNDRTVPRADLLRMAVDLLSTRGGVGAREALMALEAIMDEPSETISPIGRRFAPNLRSYLRVQSLAQIGRAMRDQMEQEEVTLPASARIQELAGTADDNAPVLLNNVLQPHHHGLGPAWRVPRLERGTGPHSRERQVSVEEFASGDRIALFGGPGSGKSAFLSYLLVDHPRWQRAERINISRVSTQRFGEWLAAQNVRAPMQPLIVDGIDEMPMEDRGRGVEMINWCAAQLPVAPILVASRPVRELDHLSCFESFSIAPLSDIDLIAEITRSALASRSPVEVDRFLCHLTERETLRPALRNPLFLRIAWSLFEDSAVTPFAEGAVVREYMQTLFERDHRKGFGWVREPWASSHSLLALLGEISLHLLQKEEVTFDRDMLRRCVERSTWKAPVSKILDLLLISGVLMEDGKRYSFAHKIFKEYFAARFVVESSTSAREYFTSTPRHGKMSGTIRMACSLASDSSSLLELVTHSVNAQTINYALLAQMLAQPIAAQPKILGESCRTLVSWLDDRTADWTVISESPAGGDIPAQWLICANVGRPKEGEVVARTLRAIHQARSGPAYEPLKAHLSEARSPILPMFAAALDVEGRLKVDFGNESVPKGTARLAVESLQLV